jgi:hypothetical protein
MGDWGLGIGDWGLGKKSKQKSFYLLLFSDCPKTVSFDEVGCLEVF